ncbi:MAG: glycoside hydrolase family 28 protein, partial [Paludibacter sp.]
MHHLKNLRTLIAIFVLVCLTKTIDAENVYDKLYKDLPFPMQKIDIPVFKDNTISILDFGGVGDGNTLNTDAFRKSIDALSQKGGGKLIVPAGIWFTGPIELKSNINL